MSAYIVNDNTINKIVSFFKATKHLPHIIREFEAAGYNLNQDVDCSRLANDMFKLNVQAVNSRYGKGSAEEFRPLDFQYRFVMPPVQIKTYQEIKEWMYQCSEGDVPNSGLFKLIDTARDCLADHIISKQCRAGN